MGKKESKFNGNVSPTLGSKAEGTLPNLLNIIQYVKVAKITLVAVSNFA